MLNRGVASIVEAANAGRIHTQRVQKNAGSAVQDRWIDWTFQSGQPLYDAKIGAALTFTPLVAQGNDAVYFPDIPAGMRRQLIGANLRSSTAGGVESVIITDVLGYYPLIDGDSTDVQPFVNSSALPRYSDGKGVCAILVSSVAPTVQNGVATMVYVDSDGNTKTAPDFTVLNTTSAGQVESTNSPTANTEGAFGIPLSSGSKGVRSVTSIQFTVPPSGIHCLYLVKTLATAVTNGNAGVSLEKCFNCHNGFSSPIIYDGAYLNLFYRHPSGANTSSWFGDFTFIWN